MAPRTIPLPPGIAHLTGPHRELYLDVWLLDGKFVRCRANSAEEQIANAALVDRFGAYDRFRIVEQWICRMSLAGGIVRELRSATNASREFFQSDFAPPREEARLADVFTAVRSGDTGLAK